jgi:hypothetical protein
MDGQYIEMEWSDGESRFELVRGWPGEAATRKAVEAFAGNDWSREWTFRECYAANLQTALSRAEGYDFEIRLSYQPGPGRYKVSALVPPNTRISKSEPEGGR